MLWSALGRPVIKVIAIYATKLFQIDQTVLNGHLCPDILQCGVRL